MLNFSHKIDCLRLLFLLNVSVFGFNDEIFNDKLIVKHVLGNCFVFKIFNNFESKNI